MFVCTFDRATDTGEACEMPGVCCVTLGGDSVLLAVGVPMFPVRVESGGVGNCSDSWLEGDDKYGSGVDVAGGVGSSGAASPGWVKSGGK